MRIHIDLTHPAHANFFRHPVAVLAGEGHDVSLSCLRRGRLPAIAAELFRGLPLTPVGRYRRGLAGMTLETGLLRLAQLAALLLRVKPEVVAGVAAFQPAMLAGPLGFRTVGIYDDPGHRLHYRLTRRLVDTFVVPECLGETRSGTVRFRGLKEWSYLRPGRFVPDEGVPAALGLEPGGYLFVRSVDTASLNYRGLDGGRIRRVYEAGADRLQAVLSLERKEHAPAFPGWRILEEPVRDIHSLLYFSRMVISSGDSMAREGAQLGVPSLYCGGRDMEANRELSGLGFLRILDDPAAVAELAAVPAPERWREIREERRQRLLAAWDDPSAVIRRAILGEPHGGPGTERTAP